MKKSIVLTLIFALISCTLLCITVSAKTTDNTERTIEYLDNDWWYFRLRYFFIHHEYNYKNKNKIL